MKKFLSILTAIGILCSCFTPVFAAGEVKYLKSDEDYDYYVWLAAKKDTGNIIPLSIEPLDGYYYAYADENTEIEPKKAEPIKFTDINSEDMDFYINEMSARGIFSGYEDGSFRPAEILTRAEMAVVFARMFGVEAENIPSVFSDVETAGWCGKYIMPLVGKGVFKADGKFNPEDFVTREQLTAMTFRMLSDMGCLKESGEYDFSQSTDAAEISDFAKEAYSALSVNGYRIISDIDYGDEMNTADDMVSFVPQQCVSRGECAEFLYDFIRTFFVQNAPALKKTDAPEAEIPVLDGSTSTYDITRNIYWQYYTNPENHPDFPKAHSKTSNSYKRLIDGEAEMIFVPDPSEDIKKYAEEKGVKLRYIPIAREALIFFTAEGNKAGNITTNQLKEIYVNNGIKNWSEAGGDNAELVPYCRNNDSGSHAQMEKFILDGHELNGDISRERTSWMMSSILTDVDDFNRNNPNKYAIGYSLYYYYLNNQMILGPVDLKLMSIDGVAPTDETIADGSYPYVSNYYAVIRDENNEKVEAFAELMQGEFGKAVVSMSGLSPIEDAVLSK